MVSTSTQERVCQVCGDSGEVSVRRTRPDGSQVLICRPCRRIKLLGLPEGETFSSTDKATEPLDMREWMRRHKESMARLNSRAQPL